MSCSFKLICKEVSNTIIFKGDLYTFPKFEQLIDKLKEKIKDNKTFKKIKLVENKFILEIIEGFELDELKSVWNSETYDYFFSKIKQNSIDKIKFNLAMVDKLPTWNPPQFTKLLKDSLDTAWISTKKEIVEELTEKYLDDGKRFFMEEKKENEPKFAEELYNDLHINIICNNCLASNFIGARYICCECNNFNLCEYCKKNTRISHNPDHTFIKLNNPVLIDIQKYKSIFSPNKKLLKLKEGMPFEINIKIINNGYNDLQGCFFSPIRFGKNYLGCLQKTIIEKCEKGDEVELEVLMTFPEDDEEEDLRDSYEGYFRLMAKPGIPFGDIFYIKVNIE